MTNHYDDVVSKQEEALNQLDKGTFWSRNKKPIIGIAVTLSLLWIFSLLYVFYFIPPAYRMTSDATENIFPTLQPLPTGRPIVTSEELIQKGSLGVQQVGNFIFNPPRDYLYLFREYSQEPVKVESRNIENINDIVCTKVNGTYHLFSARYYPEITPGFSPSFSLFAWNLNEVNFKNQNGVEVPEYKTRYNQFLQQLALLDTYSDQSKLRQEVFKQESDFTLDHGPLVGCSGGWSYPLYISKVQQTKFDSVHYAEINQGNADFEQPPTRFLFIKDNADWLIVEEMQRVGENDDLSECIPLESENKEKLECVERIWREKYRNQADNQMWINSVLEMLSKK